MRCSWMAVVTLLAPMGLVFAAQKLPEGPGLAAKYPKDAGIAKDPAVIFADDFEAGDLQKWDERVGAMAVTDEMPNGGKLCVASGMIKGKNHGGDAKKWFLPGQEKVFARVYVKYSKDYQYTHHFLTLLGSPPKQKWKPFGKAGLKPDGTYFSSGMETWFAWGKNPPPGEIVFYSYFMDMEQDTKMKKYWGNSFFPPGPERGKAASDQRVVPRLDAWQCWEFMIKCNTPDKADGEQAMWLDGKLIGHFTGLRWRDVETTKVNCLWLQHYGYDEGDPTKRFHKESQTVWFDDVVVARQYVGPRK